MSIPWIEKYRPTKLSNIIGQNSVIEVLKKSLEKNIKPEHLLFYGSPGVGKTTTILSYVYELFTPDEYPRYVLELNASNDRGINAIKNVILPFTTLYRKNKFKVLILDEADAMTDDAQTALRKIMETDNNTLFCIICNYREKIIPALLSRTKEYEFKPLSDNIIKTHLRRIYDKEFYMYYLEEDDIDYIIRVIVMLIKGDLRKGINMLQNLKYSIKNTEELDIKKIFYDMQGLMEIDKLKEFINSIKNIKTNKDIIEVNDKFIRTNYSIKVVIKQIIMDNIIPDKIDKLNKILDNEKDDKIIIYDLISVIKN